MDRELWVGVERVHGRLRILTPVTSPIAENMYTLARREKRRAARKWILLGLLIVLACLVWPGCATTPRQGVVVLSERTGSVVAKLAGVLVGQEPKAATLPGGATVVMQPSDADDACLVDAHEGTHRVQMAIRGTLAFFTEYEREYRECRAGGYASGWCLRDGMELEREAYQQQHACQAARARGEPWPAVSGRSDGRWWARCLAKEGRR